MKRRKTLFGAFIALALFLGISGAAAQMTPSIHLNADATLSGSVDLNWMTASGLTVDYYLVHRATLSDSGHFTTIDSTTTNMYVDTPPASPNGVYVYQVTAHLHSGLTAYSNIAFVRLPGSGSGEDEDMVRIVSDPVTHGEVGVPYSYQVVAKSSDSSATFRYSLETSAMGMKIDSAGLISWVPAEGGWYHVEVRVRSSAGGSAEQEYALRIGAGSGTVSGVVSDTAGAPLAHVMVKLYEREREHHFDYSTVTDSMGHYTFKDVEPASYLARAVPLRPDYVPQWYDGVRSREDATPFTVMNGGTTTVNFTLKAREAALPKFTVRGSVADSTGAALGKAVVFFVRAGFSFNAHDNHDGDDWSMGGEENEMFRHLGAELGMDFHLDGYSGFVKRVHVDSTGAYSVHLSQGSYIALAVAPGFYTQFYNHQSSFLSANVIALTSDTTGIDFRLSALPPLVLGEIKGSVIDSTTGKGVPARIIAFRNHWLHPDSLRVPRTYFTETDSTGAYTLTNLPPGSYILFALPLGQFVPSFYSTSGPTVHWKDATPVDVNGNSVSGINIFVMPMADDTPGYASIYGQINANVSGSADVAGASSNIALSGALVYALDGSGSVAGYGITDASGSYVIGELAPGTYAVTVDAAGYTSGSTSATPTYDASGNPVSAPASMTVNSVTSVNPGSQPVQPTGYALEQNYPNPFNPSTEIAFSVPQMERVNVSVYNILGQHIATLVDGVVSSGAHVATWAGLNDRGEHVASGVYLYRIAAGNFTAVRKMVLLK